MRLDRIASLFLFQPLLAKNGTSERRHLPVLMYHSIASEKEAGVNAYYRLATAPDRFRRHMHLLRDRGYCAVGLRNALESNRERGPDARPRPVAVTFDDGYRDFLTGAWPVLQELQFTATVFLPTAFIGATRRSFKGRECLTWPEVRELASAGVSFGSHTVTHPVLHGLPWAQVSAELRESREHIQDALGSPVTLFAYPYAFPQEDSAYCSRLREEMIAQGYEASVTTIIGRHSAEIDRLRIARLPINDCDDDALFLAKLAGAYDWMGTVQRGFRDVRQMASRSGGRRER